VPIDDPLLLAGLSSAYGTAFFYPDDLTINSFIDMNGLQGVNAQTALNDSNKIAIKFRVVTNCDEFTSGTPVRYRGIGTDPCGFQVNTGIIESAPIVVDGANPEDFAQILNLIDPGTFYCGTEETIVDITSQNISENTTVDSMEVCITLPPSLAWTGTLNVSVPAAYTPEWITETALPGGTQICYAGPEGIGTGQFFNTQIGVAYVDEAVECQETVLGVDIRTFLAEQECANLGTTCGVFVDNTINNLVDIILAPPIQSTEVKLLVECDDDPQNVTYNYEITLFNGGADVYSGSVDLDLFRDVDLNGEINELIDQLLDMGSTALTIPANGDTTITGSFTMPAEFACPVILRETYETSCACDETTTIIDAVPPAFFDDMEGNNIVCTGDTLKYDYCGGYDMIMEPMGGATVIINGDQLCVFVNPGYGLTSPVTLTFESINALCEQSFSANFFSDANFEFGPAFDVAACEGVCRNLDLNVGAVVEATGTVLWTPDTYLDDPTSFTPELCNPEMDMTYTVEVTLGEGCVYTAEVNVTVETSIPLTLLPARLSCYDNDPLAEPFEAEAGFDQYVWYQVIEGNELLITSTTTNLFLPTDTGTYVVRASVEGLECEAVSEAVVILNECYDLALTKTMGAGEDTIVYFGEDVEFLITVYNQGALDAYNVDVHDYLPTGLILSPNDANGWTDLGGGVLEILDQGPVAAGASIEIPVLLTIDAGFTPGDVVNFAEIIEFEDENGNLPQDIDSSDDSDPTNDGGGATNTPSDDSIDGDASGAPGDEDPATDEDDHDPEDVSLQIFDLALAKTLADGQSEFVGPGDDVTFTITVTNQGTVGAANIEVVDYIPSGYTFNLAANAGWGDSNGDGNPETTLAGPIAPGANATVDITLTVNDPFDAATMDLVNVAEIAAAEDMNGNTPPDVDSTPDSDPANDPGGLVDSPADDAIDGDGTGVPGDDVPATDEDDSDPAFVQIFDLALQKVLSPGQTEYVTAGAEVSFDINVCNQGNVDAYNVLVNDYVPNGYTFDAALNPAWADADADGNPDGTIAGPLAPAACEILTIILTVNEPFDPATMDLVNYAEIGSAEDVDGGTPIDHDSTPDNDPTNDPGGEPDSPADDMLGGDGTGTPGDGVAATDEDDADPAGVQIFDLALTKTLAAGQSAQVIPGEDVTFTITVFNQGTVDAYNTLVNDYVPNGYTFSLAANPGWGDNDANGDPDYTFAGPIAAGASATADITLTVADPFDTATMDLVNVAEIGSAEDADGNNPPDADSTPDDDGANDGGGAIDTPSDDVVDGDGTGAPGDEDPTTDEDDADPAGVDIFDLALTKVLGAGQASSVMAGDDVTYTIEVCNQGTMDAYNVLVNDYVPAGYEPWDIAINAGWGDRDADGNPDWEFAGPIAAGACVTADITLTVIDPYAGEDLLNWGEIASAEDEDGNNPPDADSTPDNDPTNDGPYENDDTDNTNGDEDDSDPEGVDIIEPASFDLALEKVLTPGQSASVAPGEDVSFDIIVTNEGAVDATDVDVTDYVPTGFTYDPAANPTWADADGDGNPTTTIAGPIIAAGGTATVTIILNVNDPYVAGTSLNNWAEISNSDPDDDSTPDDDPTNDPDGEDDIDDEPVYIFDLALTKTLSAGQSATVVPGDDVSFEITVINQGTEDAFNVLVNDYVPSGYGFDLTKNAGWGDMDADGNPDFTIGGPIAAGGGTDVLTIVLTVNDPFDATTMDLVNVAEISGAEDENGDSPTDADSTPDNDSGNDAGGEPDSPSDDVVDGDGSGAPGDEDPATDEDDSDPASVGIFDLALTKKLAAGQSAAVMAGDDVTFTIEVCNQGTVDAYNTLVNDYVPAGYEAFSLAANPGWGDSDADGNPDYLFVGPIASGTCATADITLTVIAPYAGEDLLNWGEIASSEDENGDEPTDADSTPDNDPTNDGPYENDDTDNTNGDEDDSDPEGVEIVEPLEFDLALAKTLSAGQAEAVAPGDVVSFDITVTNQGAVDAYNVLVNDYVPNGFTFDAALNAAWGDADANGFPDQVLAGPVAAGASATMSIILTVADPFDPATMSLVNVAEISAAEDAEGNPGDDTDSTPDDDPANDAGGQPDSPADDAINGDGTGTPGDDVPATDEDDADPAFVIINDLALTKSLPAGAPATVAAGDAVAFEITVFNQGTTDAYNVLVNDYVPAGYTFALAGNPGWGDIDANGHPDYTFAGPIAPGASAVATINLTVVDPYSGEDLLNWAEIAGSEDENGDPVMDADSTPDDDPTNDGPYEDDDTDNTNGDEDDSDPAGVIVPEPDTFDLALAKTLSAGQTEAVTPGAEVSFDITVTNQGAVDAYNVLVNDYVPSGFTFDAALNPLWGDADADGKPDQVATGPIAPAATATMTIVLTVNDPFDGATMSLVNVAEISAAEDADGNPGDDIDSTPDTDPTNDPGGAPDSPADDTIDGDGTGTPGDDVAATDEDDSDPESVYIFDLALTKTLSTGQASVVTAGDLVSFDITVVNQGTVDAYNVLVNDYVPAGYTFSLANNIGWGDADANGAPDYTFAGPVAANGGSAAATIVLTVIDPYDGEDLLNWAEIGSAEDPDGNNPEDADSTPDDDPTNDGPYENDDIDNTNGDEDDSDPEGVTVEDTDVFDLALIKTVDSASDSPIIPGTSTVTYAIDVINQGTVDATGVEVTDYIPACLTLNDPTWTLNADGDAVYNNLLNLVAGQTFTVYITLAVETCAASTTVINFAEISDDGPDGEDVDSTPDGDDSNDGPSENDDVDNTNGDEDDHDGEPLDVPGIFDLALVKTVGSTSDTPLVAGSSTVTFNIEIINQGTVDATAVEVTDYIPACLSLSDGGWALNADGSATLNTLLNIAAGASQTVTITLTVDACADGTITNWAEISDDGPAGDDVDSTPDGDDSNDGPSENDDVDNTNGDEDDHDGEPIEVPTPLEFDLALIKTLAAGQSSTVSTGDAVAYEIIVTNQGAIAADFIVLTDYMPSCMSLSDAAWSDNGDGTASYELSAAAGTMATPLASGATVTVPITLTVGACAEGTTTNWAEISDDGAETDSDSTPDSDDSNDTYTTNDDTSGDGLNGGDEDDHDPEEVTVVDITFDLALIKTVASTSDTPPIAGSSTVTYAIEVINQGATNATGVQVTDYIPACLTLSDAAWTVNAAGNADYNQTLSIATGASQIVYITFDIDACASGTTITNLAEISDDGPGEDVDSTPDTDPFDDPYINDEIDDDGTNDEDDHDGEELTVPMPDVFDLALRKTVLSADEDPINPGTTEITFEIEVFNQGSVDATGVTIIDYLPSCTSLADPTWTAAGANATYNTPLSVVAGQTATIYITLLIEECAAGQSLINFAEITDDGPGEDQDSTPDTNPSDDPYVDDEVNDDGTTDEDDHDGAPFEVPDPSEFDLALKKTVSFTSSDPISTGTTVAFAIEVINQGTEDASDIEITDYLPAGLTLTDPNWTNNGDGTATYNNLLSLNEAQTTTIFAFFTVDAGFTGSTSNYAEISAANGEDGQPGDDIDSTPDTDNTNDPLVDDETGDDGTTDEDDHDIATISTLIPMPAIDVEKSTNGADADSATGADVPTITEGDAVNWEYVVTNTGNVDLAGVDIVDDIEGPVCTIPFLPVGQSATCVLSGTATVGLYGNVATATGTPVDENGDPIVDENGDPIDEPTDEDPSHYNGDEDFVPNPSILLEKATNGFDADVAGGNDVPVIYTGDPVTWTYVASNNGNVDLANVEITDNVEGYICTIPFLPVGESGTCQFAGTAQLGDYENVGTAAGDPVDENGDPLVDENGNPVPSVEDDDPSHYVGDDDFVPSPAIDLEKATNGADADLADGVDVPAVMAGDEVIWTYVVTNTGNLDLINVAITDDVEGFICIVPSLVVGEEASCTHTGVATEGLYANMGSAVGIPLGPDGVPLTTKPVTDDDPSHYEGEPDFVPAPAIEIEKSTNGADADLAGGADVPVVIVGTTVIWEYTIVNTGNVDLIDVAITDNVEGAICTVPFIGVGQTATCMYSGIAQEGEYENIGSVTGTPVDENGDPIVDENGDPIDEPTDDDPSHYEGDPEFEPVPGINIEKSTNGADADDANGADVPVVMAGDQITWTYTVLNTGNVDLINVTVNDNVEGAICTIPFLPIGQPATCSYQGIAVIGMYENIGEVIGTPVDEEGDPMPELEEPEDQDTSHYMGMEEPNPSIDVEKSTNGADADLASGADVPMIAVGDAVVWEYVVTNNGNVDLIDVAIVDDVEGAICTLPFLPVGGTAVCMLQGIATEGLYGNVANATGSPVDENGDPIVDENGNPIDDVTDEDPSHYEGTEEFIPNPLVHLEKSTNGADADLASGADVPVILEGDAVTWEYVITNTGNVDLVDVVVTDDIEGAVCSIPFLPIDGTATCNLTGVAQSGDYANLGSVTGSPVDENGDPLVDENGNPVDDVTDEDPSHYVGEDDFVALPAIDVEKSTNGLDADTAAEAPLVTEGDVVSWEYVVTNTGNVALSNVQVTDDVEGFVCAIPFLPVGQNATCSLQGIAGAELYSNLATTTGTPVDENGDPILDENGDPIDDVTDEDPSHYVGEDDFVPTPAVDMEKTTNGVDADTAAEAVVVEEGDLVTWTYTAENTGNVDLADVVVTDNIEGDVCTIPFLPVGTSATCNLSGIATEGLYSNLGTVTGTPVDENGDPIVDENGDPIDDVTDEDPSHYDAEDDFIADPSIALQKSTNGVDADLASQAVTIAVGDAVVWEYTATNDGNVDLVNVTITDDIEGFVCTVPALAVGASATCDITGLATEGLYANLGSVTGSPVDENGNPLVDENGNPVDDVSDNDPSHYDGEDDFVADPSVELEKTTNGADADLALGADVPDLQVGDAVVWEYTATNTGNVDLADVTITDDVEGFVCDIPVLPVGQTATCTLNSVATAGLYENLGSVTGTPVDENGDPIVDENGNPIDDVEDNDPSHYMGDPGEEPNPDVHLEKSTNGVDADSAADAVQLDEGDAVVWEYTATNTGNVDLADVSITDDQEGFVCEIPVLPVGETATCTLNGVAGDGSYSNLGTVSGTPVDENGDPIVDNNGNPIDDVEDTDPSHYDGNPDFVADPSVEFEKTTNGVDADNASQAVEVAVGDAVVWEYTATNDGNVDLADVTITDDIEGFVCEIPVLPVGETATCTLNGIATEGLYSNLGTVTGTPVDENGDPILDNNGNPIDDVEDEDPSHYDGETDFVANPSIDIEKSTNGLDADSPVSSNIPNIDEGDQVTWTYEVSNTGNVDLADVQVYDNEEGFVCEIPLIPVGADATCQLTGIAQAGLYSNIGTATGTPVDENGDPIGGDVEDEDPSHYVGDETFNPDADIHLEKTTNGFDADGSDDSDVPTLEEGDDVTWEYTVSNTGNVDLIDLVITDDEEGFVCEIASLEVGEEASCSLDGTAGDSNYNNVGSVTGTPVDENGDPVGNDVSDTDPSHYEVEQVTGNCPGDPYQCDDMELCTEEQTSITICPTTCGDGPFDIIDVESLFHCSLVELGDGCVTYTPLPGMDAVGADYVIFTLEDESGCKYELEVTITIGDCEENEPPVAVDDFDNTDGSPITIDVLNNDSDPDGDDLYICDFDQPDNGSVELVDGEFVYTPDSGFEGTDEFNYTICDGNGGEDEATVYIEVELEDCENEVVYADCIEPVTPTIFCPEFCEFPDGDFEITDLQTTYECALTILDDGCVRYIGLPGFEGQETLEIEACDGGVCATVTFVFNVGNCDGNENNAPNAVHDEYETDEDEDITFNVFDNDSDSDGDDFYFCNENDDLDPDHGSLDVDDDGEITYTPDAGFTGTDQFTYTICDGNGGSDQTTVTIEVIGVACEVEDQQYCIGPVEVIELCVDWCGSDVEITDVETLFDCSLGDPEDNCFSYISLPGFEGQEVIEIEGCDGGDCETAFIYLTVSTDCDNVGGGDVDAHSDYVDANCGSISIEVLDNDDGDDLEICDVNQPNHGSVEIDGDEIIYTPEQGYSGTVSFQYEACNDDDSDVSTVHVTVDCDDDSEEVDAHSDYVYSDCDAITIAVLDNDEGSNLEICDVDQPNHGSVEIDGEELVYTPEEGYDGTVSFQYTACNDDDSDQSTVHVNADCEIEDFVDAHSDQYETTNNTIIALDLADNDEFSCSNPDVEILSQPSHGIVIEIGGVLTYVPELGHVGQVSFEYELCCGNECDESTVTIQVNEHEECVLAELKIPTVLTPNDDGYNDQLVIEGLGSCDAQTSVKIFDRLGNSVYVADSYRSENVWRGEAQNAGTRVPAGTYFIVVETIDGNDVLQSRTGFIEIR